MPVVEKTPFTLFEEIEAATPGAVIRKRSLRFDINALADFEQETGMGFGQLMSTRAVFATARALLWAGLKHEDRTLTVEKVGTLLGKYVMRGGAIDIALSAAFLAAKEQGAFGDNTKDDEGTERPNDQPQAASGETT